MRALEFAGDRPLRLVATAEGLPLYEKLGFRRVRHDPATSGRCAAVDGAPQGTELATADDIRGHRSARPRRLRRRSRSALIACLASVGQFAVIRRDGRVTGFAALRAFGRGEVIGPVVATERQMTPRHSFAFFMAARPGPSCASIRIATAACLPWLGNSGLAHVGGGIAMAPARQSREPAHARSPTFALANQALG